MTSPWTVHYVTLAWGGWSLATLAFREGHDPDRAFHFGRLTHSNEPTDKALRALRLWLKSFPAEPTTSAYERFAAKYNRRHALSVRASCRPKEERTQTAV